MVKPFWFFPDKMRTCELDCPLRNRKGETMPFMRDLAFLVSVAWTFLVTPLAPLHTTEWDREIRLSRVNDVENHTKMETTFPIPAGKDLEYCSVVNSVLAHRTPGSVPDEVNIDGNTDTPHSLTRSDFRRHHDRICRTPKELLDAIKFGTRKWDNPMYESLPPEKRENYPSYFVPHECDIQPLSSGEMCAAMNLYSHVVNVGGSSSRHLHQGVFVGLRSDLVSGGIHSSHTASYDRCRCDGQFSMIKECRLNDGRFFETYPHDIAICSRLDPLISPFRLHHDDRINGVTSDNRAFGGVDCRDKESRGVLLLMQGGTRFGMNATNALSWVKRVLSNRAALRHCRDEGRLTVVWSSNPARSWKLDDESGASPPHERREHDVEFNREMEERLRSLKMNVTAVDWFNFTLDAQTSDGSHFLTDVNLFKGYYLLTLAGMLKAQ